MNIWYKTCLMYCYWFGIENWGSQKSTCIFLFFPCKPLLFFFCLCKNQVQNLTIRGQQVATTSSSQTQTLQALSLKQTPVPIQPASVMKNPTQGASTGAKASSNENSSDVGKKGDSAAVTEVRAINMSRNVNTVSTRPLIAPGEWTLQPKTCQKNRKNVLPITRTKWLL